MLYFRAILLYVWTEVVISSVLSTLYVLSTRGYLAMSSVTKLLPSAGLEAVGCYVYSQSTRSESVGTLMFCSFTDLLYIIPNA